MMILVGISMNSFAFAQEGVYVRCTEHSDRGQSKGIYDFSEIALTYGTSSTMMSSVFHGERYYVGIADAGLVASKRLPCGSKAPGKIEKEQGQHHQQPAKEQEPSKAQVPPQGEHSPRHAFPPAPLVDREAGQARTIATVDSKTNDCGEVSKPTKIPSLQVVLMKLPSHSNPSDDIEMASHVKSVKLYPGETKKVHIEYRHGFPWTVETKLECTLEYPAQGL